MLRLILMPIVAGFIATIGITSVLWAIDKSGWTKADMVRAIGSFFTKSLDNALRIGLLIHFVGGIVFAAVYLHILSILGPQDMVSEILMGGVLGLGQGLLSAIALSSLRIYIRWQLFRKRITRSLLPILSVMWFMEC